MIKINALLYAKMISMLVDGPVTVHEIVYETGLHSSTVAKHIRAMKRMGLLAVGGWEKDSRGTDQIPIYEWGRKHDKPRSKMTAAQRTAAYRTRRSAQKLVHIMAGGSA